MLEVLAGTSGVPQSLEDALMAFVVAAKRLAGTEGRVAPAVFDALDRIESVASLTEDDQDDGTTAWRPLLVAAWAAAGLLREVVDEDGKSIGDQWVDWLMGSALEEVIFRFIKIDFLNFLLMKMFPLVSIRHEKARCLAPRVLDRDQKASM